MKIDCVTPLIVLILSKHHHHQGSGKSNRSMLSRSMKVTSPDYPSLPYLAHTLASSPPVYVYSAVFQENTPSSSSEKMPFGFQASSNVDLMASIDSRGSRYVCKYMYVCAYIYICIY
jgi:hypothetical protein